MSELSDALAKDVEPDSPVVPVKRRRTLTSDSTRKNLHASDDASQPEARSMGSDGVKRMKKSRKRMPRIVPRALQRQKIRARSSGKKSIKG